MGQIRNKVLIKKLARRIKLLRQQKGVTQEKFYFDTDIHIGRIEAGRANISVSTLDAICSYFGLTLSSFFKEIEDE